MKTFATYPTPYGVSVPLFDNPAAPGEYLFGMDATAICAGIYDPKERARFAADATALGRCDMDRLGDYGGGRPPRFALPRPESPAFPQIKDIGSAVPIDSWVTALLDRFRWCDRADELLVILGCNLDQAKGCGLELEPIMSLGLQIMLTGTLEHLPDGDIDCLEAAAFYALTVHTEWIEPALNWLEPVSHTWSRNWVKARPKYRRFAKLCSRDSSLPQWIAGGRA